MRRGAAAATAFALSAPILLGGCATAAVVGAVGGTAVAAGSLATKAAVGAGRLAVKGGKVVVDGTVSAIETTSDLVTD